MAASANVRLDGRPYVELPFGIQPWSASRLVTGNAGGGEMQVTFLFNPSADRSFQPYVSLHHVGIIGDVALLTNPVVTVQQNGDNWERAMLSVLTAVDLIEMSASLSAVSSTGSSGRVTYLGRVEQGTAGTLKFACLNTNTATMNVVASGFYSDRPFVAQDYWRI